MKGINSRVHVGKTHWTRHAPRWYADKNTIWTNQRSTWVAHAWKPISRISNKNTWTKITQIIKLTCTTGHRRLSANRCVKNFCGIRCGQSVSTLFNFDDFRCNPLKVWSGVARIWSVSPPVEVCECFQVLYCSWLSISPRNHSVFSFFNIKGPKSYWLNCQWEFDCFFCFDQRDVISQVRIL